MPPREYAVELPTHSAAVLEWGPPDGPLVVALHGFPDTAWTWRRVAPLLAAAGYRVVAPFLRGYAPSGIPVGRDYSVGALAADAIALHDHLGGGPAALVGHDWGAITGSALAGDPASPYDRVAILAVPPLAWMNPRRATLRPWLAAMARQPFRSWYIGYNQVPGLAERHFPALARRLWRRWSPGYDAADDLAYLRAAVPDRAHAAAVVSYYRSRDLRPAFAQPRTPLLYVHGDRDGALDPAFFDVVRPHVANAVLLSGAGHFLHLEQPNVVAGHLIEFFGGV